MGVEVAIAIGIALLGFNAFFVGSEFAILSARRSAIEPLAAAGDKRAQTVIWAMEHVSLMLAACQIGVTVCSVGLGSVAEPAIAKAIEPLLHTLGISSNFVHPIAFVFALVTVVYLHVVIGEMVPKNLSVSNPDTAVLMFGPPLVMFARTVKPLVYALNWFANHFVKWSGVEPRDEVASAYTAEEVQSIVEASQAEGSISDDQGLLSGAIEFSEKTVRDVMVSRDSLTCLEEGFTPADVEREVTRTGFSRFPITDGRGEIQGYIHVKDVLWAHGEERDQAVSKTLYRNLAVSRPNDEVEESLLAMQHSGAHLARVTVEGTLQGIVFLEDIIEELVGEVRDAMQR